MSKDFRGRSGNCSRGLLIDFSLEIKVGISMSQMWCKHGFGDPIFLLTANSDCFENE